ncbi:MAG: mechanosensitive ion channel protein MscS [Bacteroidetes bacterium HGW-Bacteroidetes-4]|jgi:small-conductance mechanosensitive channel|nr:MAG: mechanosensitive ion channel protein MscS [Bacteroidetes bacterium HGW-Bacteroidetes-4]
MRKYKNLVLPLFLTLFFVGLEPALTLFRFIPARIIDLVQSYGHLLLIITLAWSAIALLKIFRKLLLSNFDISKEDNLKSRKVHTQVNIFTNIITFFIVLIALGFILISFESIRKIGIGLFASAGIAGIILGLAAQRVIGAVIAGIQIAFTQPFRIDDAVIIENEWGWIEEINLNYVVVRIWDKRRLIVPSTYFIEKPFQNWTRNSAEIVGTVFIYADYTLPVQALRDELTRILNATELWDGQVNVLQVTDAKENTMELRALVSAKNSPTAWDLRVHVREKLIEFMQHNYADSLPKTRIQLQDKTMA